MTLSPGSRLGPYEIVSRLGAGGMGEVFRARDTRLDRSVAIKILPAELEAQSHLKARFEREAKTISQLNHPNICTLHDVGHENGTSYLVLELVDGETLAARIARGPMPLADVVRYGSQIAAALDRAHRAGVVHRDLKPANVMLTKSGAKLLDFGLARPSRPAFTSADAPTAHQDAITADGTVVGTVPYMAPEQLQGSDPDPRTDIFALGAVLYEMITGRRAFDGKTSVSLIAQILEGSPPQPSAVQPITPPALEHVVMTCLAKDPDARFQCAADVAHALDCGSKAAALTAEAKPPRVSKLAAMLIAIVVLIAAAAAFTAYRLSQRTPTIPDAKFAQLTFDSGEETHPAIAPDGKMFAFVKAGDIFIQRVDGRSAINLTRDNPLADSEPAFSPDGSQIAFRSERDGGGIFIMGATGESVRRLTDRGFSPAWSPDGKEIIYTTERFETARISYGMSELHVADLASGATRKLFAGDARQPRWSPNGHRIAWFSSADGHRNIFTIDRSGAAGSIVAVTDDQIATDWNPVWSPAGDALYFISDRGGSMNVWRVAIDEESGRVEGEPEPLRLPSPDIGPISVAAGGQLVYQSTVRTGELMRYRFDPPTETVTAEEKPVFAGSMLIRHVAVSSDGRWIAFTTADAQEDLFVVAADGTGLRQLTNDMARDRGVSWSPDESRIFFYSNRTGRYYGYSIRPDGSGLMQLTAGSETANWPRLSPDGRWLTYIWDRGGNDTESRIAEAGGRFPVTKGELLPRTPTGPFSIRSWSPDATMAVGGPWGPSTVGLHLYSLADRKLRALPLQAVNAVFVDNRRILFIDKDERLGIHDLATDVTRIIGPFPTARGRIATRAFSNDSRLIATFRTSTESDVWQMSIPEKTP